MKFAPHTVLPLSALLAAFVAPGAFATEFGTVVSSTPVYSQVPVPQRVCEDEQVSVAQRPSGAGAVAGAVIGGAVGNAVGAGGGRAAATALGLMLGAVVGNNAEAGSLPPTSATAQRCRTVTQYEDRPVGYDVVYEYAGARRTARLGQDPGGPGSRIALDVAPAGAAARSAATAAATKRPWRRTTAITRRRRGWCTPRRTTLRRRRCITCRRRPTTGTRIRRPRSGSAGAGTAGIAAGDRPVGARRGNMASSAARNAVTSSGFAR